MLLAPIETSSRLILTGEDLRKVAQSGPPGAFLYRNSRVWLWFWKDIARMRGGPVFDALAMIAAIKPGAIRAERRFATMNAAGELIADRRSSKECRSVRFCTDFEPGVVALLKQRLCARPRQLSAQ
jgi:inosine-uridine nucleoside N-ribohydrolase